MNFRTPSYTSTEWEYFMMMESVRRKRTMAQELLKEAEKEMQAARLLLNTDEMIMEEDL